MKSGMAGLKQGFEGRFVLARIFLRFIQGQLGPAGGGIGVLGFFLSCVYFLGNFLKGQVETSFLKSSPEGNVFLNKPLYQPEQLALSLTKCRNWSKAKAVKNLQLPKPGFFTLYSSFHIVNFSFIYPFPLHFRKKLIKKLLELPELLRALVAVDDGLEVFFMP